MSIFEPLDRGLWRPSPLAAGPFNGLQGGAVAGLLTAELEGMAAEKGWGQATSVTAWFLRPAPMTTLRTATTSLIEGGRVSVVDNTLRTADQDEVCATVRVTCIRERAVSIPDLPSKPVQPCDPIRFPVRTVSAAHGRPWFMDAMEARVGDDAMWFRLKHEIIPGAGPLASVLGPSDWTHGLARPLQNVAADPNPNLTVHLFRKPASDWIGIQAQTWWQPDRGLGMGRGLLRDVLGEIGCVSMSVVLLPWPKAAAPARSS